MNDHDENERHTLKHIAQDIRSIKETLEHHHMMLHSIKQQGVDIMATQAELVTQLNAVKDNIAKIGTETTALLKEVDDLKTVIANGPPVTPELQAAVDAVAAQAKVVDDLVPDAPPAPTP